MGDFDLELATELIRQGVPVDEAFRTAGADEDRPLTKMVLPFEGLGSAPDPACVAAQLQGIDNPSREEIARAIDHCTR